MKRLRLLAGAGACLLLTGCSNPLLPESSITGSSETEQYDFPRYDIDSLQTRIEALKKIWKEPGKEADIAAEIEYMLNADDEAAAISTRAEIAYYADWSDAELFDAYSVTREDADVVDEMVTWCFANGAKFSDYKELFAPYVDESWMDYYTLTKLSRVMSSARLKASDSGEKLDEYYDTAYDSDMSSAEQNRFCAELYLDLLKEYDLSDYLYSSYGRDYTAEQASEAAAAVLDELVPLSEALYSRLIADPNYDRIIGSDQGYDAYALLKQYAPRISPYVAESVQKLFDEKLYTTAEGDDCYDGCFTVSLPNEKSALIYTYLKGNFTDIISVSHEFGHFHSDWRDQTPVYMQVNCVDIAESQSQSMEMLFTSFYGDIFGEDASFMERLAIYNILDSVIAGLAVGEFEYRVMQNAERFTPEDVVECFQDLNEQYGIGLELYEISHLFEQPGYYVSYGVSALPAIELYVLMQEDYDSAVSTYDTLSSISSCSGETGFSEAIAMCGLRDPFDEDTMSYISRALHNRLEQLE